MKRALKQVLGGLPHVAELYQDLLGDGSAPLGGYRLGELEGHLPSWVQAVRGARNAGPTRIGKRVLMIGYLRWWLEYTVALGLLLAAEGHQVHLGYLPYRRWTERVARFDRRRQSRNVRKALHKLRGVLELHDLSGSFDLALPDHLYQEIERQSLLDVQYTIQREDIDRETERELFKLRLDRNQAAASSVESLLENHDFDAVIIPNGSVLEFGAAYRTAMLRNVPPVTFEFGEQRERMWIAQGGEVMRLDTDRLWAARGEVPLTQEEIRSLEQVYEARRGATVWRQFRRQWQRTESRGARAARKELRLDEDRPLALLCTNVVGDSLALDRQIFSHGMADWMEKTVQFFAEQSDVQLVVRVHPGEMLGAGHPSVDIVHDSVADLPQHVIVVPPDSQINTYDLVELAHLGLVYTTTVGLEMAMAGIPVIVAGSTHYRGKGFTIDPDSWDAYWNALRRALARPSGERIPEAQSDLAARYAYRFFFEFPFPFPWHLIDFWEDIAARPFEEVVTAEGRKPYRGTLNALVGNEISATSTGAAQEAVLER